MTESWVPFRILNYSFFFSFSSIGMHWEIHAHHAVVVL